MKPHFQAVLIDHSATCTVPYIATERSLKRVATEQKVTVSLTFTLLK